MCISTSFLIWQNQLIFLTVLEQVLVSKGETNSFVLSYTCPKQLLLHCFALTIN